MEEFVWRHIEKTCKKNQHTNFSLFSITRFSSWLPLCFCQQDALAKGLAVCTNRWKWWKTETHAAVHLQRCWIRQHGETSTKSLKSVLNTIYLLLLTHYRQFEQVSIYIVSLIIDFFIFLSYILPDNTITTVAVRNKLFGCFCPWSSSGLCKAAHGSTVLIRVGAILHHHIIVHTYISLAWTIQATRGCLAY